MLPAIVEMAGIEPASERIDRRISTSVVNSVVLPGNGELTNHLPASRLDPKVLFHTFNDVTYGTLTL